MGWLLKLSLKIYNCGVKFGKNIFDIMRFLYAICSCGWRYTNDLG